MTATLDHVWTVLDAVADPEIPVVSLRELGILRDVRMGDAGVEVVITPTYSGCPAMGQMADDVAAALAAHGIVGKVVTQLSPAWTTDWIGPAALIAAACRRGQVAHPVDNALAAEALVGRVLARQRPDQDNSTVVILAVGRAADATPRSARCRHGWWIGLGVGLLLAGAGGAFWWWERQRHETPAPAMASPPPAPATPTAPPPPSPVPAHPGLRT